ncbi:hypothetical protein DESPIGER_0869 [Desulfovibrio piger]|uniref:Uncharacterized protein n=1 Tax=Desulfovibrio piger TaxID=901 RepID=A0A1K1LDG6_9BACT|nr:hypothetical protein DESPIGER_0869 [Desulfovibrio piger]
MPDIPKSFAGDATGSKRAEMAGKIFLQKKLAWKAASA